MIKKIYDGNKLDTTDYFSQAPIYINSAGINRVTEQPFTVIRERGRSDYHIVLLVHGQCLEESFGTKTRLTENRMVLLEPNRRQKYSFFKDSLSYWVHFSGTCIPEYLTKLRLEPGIYHLRECRDILPLFDKIIQIYQHCTILPEQEELSSQASLDYFKLKNAGFLIDLLCTLTQQVYHFETSAISSDFIRFINKNLGAEIDIDAFASKKQISRHRYNELFKQETGLSPHQYHINVKLEAAKWYLLNSNLSISEIADKLGYADVLYFSRLFKKKTGVCPSLFGK